MALECTTCGRPLWEGIPYFKLELVSPYEDPAAIYYCSETGSAREYAFREEEDFPED